MTFTEYLNQQAGVIARRQALATELTENGIERLLRNRELVHVFPGVYVNHTGPLTDLQREWAAILTCRRAALAGRSALTRAGIATGSDHEPRRRLREVEIAIPHDAKAVHRPGVRVSRRRDFSAIVHPTKTPPTLRIEEAVLDVAQAANELTAAAILSDACRSRKTTAGRLRQTACNRTRLRQRAFLLGVLEDAAAGTHSLLEWRYRRDVELAHALPHALRQVHTRDADRTAYRDVAYTEHGLVVELDGRLGHDLAVDRWSDLDRDIASAEAGLHTVRLGYGQVLTPCRTAAGIARVLTARGWRENPQVCGDRCSLKP